MNDGVKLVPVPPRMRHLPTDKRGYPIPETVYRDNHGNPHFTINDEFKRRIYISRDLCPICGKKLNRARWFVGGPLSAFDPNGTYIDPPLHHECANYALQVCPYLAMPHYKRIDAATLEKVSPDELKTVLVDMTMLPDRPDFFVSIMSTGQIVDTTSGHCFIAPVRPCRRVEFWRRGKRMLDGEGRALVAELLKKPLPTISPPRFVMGGKP